VSVPVVIVEYDSNWPSNFFEEKERIEGAVGEYITDIEHIGSTSVPGLGAKPTIDIMIALPAIDGAGVCIKPLEGLGYTYIPEFESEIPERRFFRKEVDGQPTHHIHMVEKTTRFWKRHIHFRDYLKSHPETVDEYFDLKKDLAQKFVDDREGYTDAKTDFVVSIEKRAAEEWEGNVLKIFQVDAFTGRPFSGNPAAVCFLKKELGDEWLQGVAAEMNLSETAFLLKREDGYSLRWFTPKTEVDLCGHATLAAMHILVETGLASTGKEITFHTKSGVLRAREMDGMIQLDFPAKGEQEAAPPEGLLEALDCEALYIGKNQMDYLVQVADEQTVRGLSPDFKLLDKVEMRGVIVTAKSNDESVDFVSRFFAPRVGVNEDPVTGSAHCCLGPYWQEKLGKNEMYAVQASERGGRLGVRVEGDRVFLLGWAVTIFKGEITC